MRFLLPAALLATACGGPAKPTPVAPCPDIPLPPVTAPSTATPTATPPAHASTEAPPAPPPAPVAAPSPAPLPPEVEKAVSAADRTEEDKELDAGRHPGELLAFLALTPGARVAELGAGSGYTTELLARAVGPKGKLWAQNSAGFLKFVGKPWGERLRRPAMKGVVRVDREFDAPFPPDAKNLDAVVDVLVYHDTVWAGVDRDKMNKAVFDALRGGGQYVIVDHSAADGHATSDVKTLHRIDEKAVVEEVERAGFHSAGEAGFLRNPGDPRDWNTAPFAAAEKRGTSDRFVLKFVKP